MEEGDTVGMLVDLDVGTLAVYKNGERLGVMVRPGMSVQEWNSGGSVPALVGPVRWAVDLWNSASVRVERKDAPTVTAGDLAEDARKAAEYDRGAPEFQPF